MYKLYVKMVFIFAYTCSSGMKLQKRVSGMKITGLHVCINESIIHDGEVSTTYLHAVWWVYLYVPGRYIV